MSESANRLSQNNLKTWQTCRRKFRYQFIDELKFSSPIEQQENMEKGRQFHLTLQQERLGIDVEPMVDNDPQLRLWLDNYHKCPPPLIEGKEYVEIYRSWEMAGVILVGIYDLMVMGKNQAQIVDWKTHQTPMKFQFLEQEWQTKLYLYLLKNISNFPAQNLSMTYWFANDPQNFVTINYSQAWHDRIHQELVIILEEINLESEYSPLFPGSKPCQWCEFRYRCFLPEQLNTDNLERSISSARLDNFPEVAV